MNTDAWRQFAHTGLVEEVADRIRQFGVVLVKLSSLDGDDDVARSLTDFFTNRGSEVTMLRAIDAADSIRGDAPFTVVHDFSTICGARHNERLAHLRVNTSKILGEGRKAILVCDIDVDVFADVDGSSVFLDAKPWPITRKRRTKIVEDFAMSGMSGELPPGFGALFQSTGQLGLLRKAGSLPFHEAIRQGIREAADRVGLEAGALLLREMDRVLADEFGSGESTLEPSADAVLQLFVALRQHAPGEVALARRIVAERLHSAPFPQRGADRAFVLLWRLERALRRLISDATLDDPKRLDNYMKGDRAELILKRARAENPTLDRKEMSVLEWLTLDELLDAFQSKNVVGSRFRSHERRMSDVRREAVRLRNDIMHFRSVADLGAKVRSLEVHVRFVEGISSTVSDTAMG